MTNVFYRLSLMKNGQKMISTWGDGGGYQPASTSIILTLDKNDRVNIVVDGGMIHDSKTKTTAYTTFSGFRIN